MAEPLATRQKQVLAKIEGTKGTYETLIATDTVGRIKADSSFEPNRPIEPRELARPSIGSLGGLPGEKAGTIKVIAEINPSDTITDDLENEVLIRGCGFCVTDLKEITIGAVGNGPFTRGETVTDESAATARVVVEVADGTTRLLHDPISGVLTSGDLLTGSTSGATATAGGSPANAGFMLNPASDDQESVSIELQQDGYAWSMAGCAGNLVGTFESSMPGFWEFTMQGPRNDEGDKALTSGVVYEEENPAILQGAGLEINDVAVVAHSISMDMQNAVTLRKSMNVATTGIISAYIPKRNPQFVIALEQIPSATLDLFGYLTSATKIPIKFNLGTADGKIVYVFADLAQVMSISLGDAEGIATIDVTFEATESVDGADDDVEIVVA